MVRLECQKEFVRTPYTPSTHTSLERKALVTAELMVILHLSMAYYKGNHLL
jgi:hypothetical protein